MNNKYKTNYLNSANKHILAGQDVFNEASYAQSGSKWRSLVRRP